MHLRLNGRAGYRVYVSVFSVQCGKFPFCAFRIGLCFMHGDAPFSFPLLVSTLQSNGS